MQRRRFFKTVLGGIAGAVVVGSKVGAAPVPFEPLPETLVEHGIFLPPIIGIVTRCMMDPDSGGCAVDVAATWDGPTCSFISARPVRVGEFVRIVNYHSGLVEPA